MLFVWVIFKIFDVVIVGSSLTSNDHCYILLIVSDHFELRILYVHTLFSITSDQKSLIKSIFVGKNYLDKSGWSGPTPDHPTFSAKTLLSKPGWSDPTSDHPNLEISGWSGPSPDHPDPAPKTSLVMSGWSDLTSDHPALTVLVYIGWPWGALTLSFFFHRRHPFSPQKLRAAIWILDQGLVELSCSFDSPRLRRSGPLRNSFDSRGNLKGISFKIPSPRSLNVGSSRWFPPMNHLLYLSRGPA